MNSNKKLLEPFYLKYNISLRNRIVLAPILMQEKNRDRVPSKKTETFYLSRSDAGLIITGVIMISPESSGYPNTVGIYTKKQIESWRKINKKIHLKDGKIFCQLWHAGRLSHQDYLNGKQPIAPSPFSIKGKIAWSNGLEYPIPRELSINEIREIISQYCQAAKNALEAEFDGVELHGGNGYLIDQFLHKSSNCRNDLYGGSKENRARFSLELVDQLLNSIPNLLLGIRLSPAAFLNMQSDKEDSETFSFLLQELNKRPLAYIHGCIDDDEKIYDYLDGTVSQFLRKHFKGTLIANGKYNLTKAEATLDKNAADLVSFGKLFIANANLVECVKEDLKPKKFTENLLDDLFEIN